MKNNTLCRISRFLLAAIVLALPSAARTRAGSLDEIRRRGVLTIGSDMTYPPFELKTGDRIEGFDIDLGNEIGKDLGVKVQWVNISWDGIFAGLQTKKYDLVLSDVVITDKRKQEMAFSRPYFLSGQTIARRKEDGRINSYRDLKDRLVAVQQETTGQYAVEKLGIPHDTIRRFETMQDALLDVRNGHADCAVGDMPALREMIRKGYPELETVGGVFTNENYAVVARRGEPDLLAAVNGALAHIFADGRYARIYRTWLREPLPPNTLAGLEKVKGQGTAVTDRAAGSALTIHWGLLASALPLLLKGAIMTLWLTVLTLCVGVPAGLLIALARLTGLRGLAPARVPGGRLLSVLATVYVEVIRGTPLLVQIFVVYFVLPSLGLSLPQIVAALTALSLNAAAYISEIFRAGIESIDRGQMEAARSLGMDYTAAMRWVILPQTLRRVLPPLTNEAVALLKDSSLVSIIGLAELTRVGREQASNSGSPVTIVLAVAGIYLLMTLPLTHLVRRLEQRWQPISRPTVRAKALEAERAA